MHPTINLFIITFYTHPEYSDQEYSDQKYSDQEYLNQKFPKMFVYCSVYISGNHIKIPKEFSRLG